MSGGDPRTRTAAGGPTRPPDGAWRTWRTWRTQRTLRVDGLVASAAAWGVAEALLFIVVPDVIVSFAALSGAKRGFAAAAAAVAGSLVGGAALYAWATVDPSGAVRAVGAVPFLIPRLMHESAASLAASGPAALVRGGFSGVPYKAFVVQAPGLHIGLGALLAWTVAARGVRFSVSALVGAAFGRLARGRLGAWGIRAGWALVWTAICAHYWTSLAR